MNFYKSRPDSASGMKKTRPGSAMTNNMSKAAKSNVFNFKSNNSNLTEDQIISRKQKAYKSYLHTKNQLEIENKQTKELENKLNQVLFKKSDLKVQLLNIVMNCKNDHGEINNVNIRYQLDRILNDQFVKEWTDNKENRFHYIPHDELIKNFKKMRDMHIKQISLKNDRYNDTNSSEMHNIKGDSKLDELSIQGTGHG